MADTMEPSAQSRGHVRAMRVGEVVSAGMAKTCVVKVTRKVRHPEYNKYVVRSSKLYAHDEENTAKVGDVVRVMSTRPLSKLKRWRVVEVLERAK
jgi:small subunit ribosomal protein S17